MITWLRFVFGAFLIWSGIQAAKDEGEEAFSMRFEAVSWQDVEETTPVVALRWLLGDRLLNGYDKEAHLASEGLIST